MAQKPNPLTNNGQQGESRGQVGAGHHGSTPGGKIVPPQGGSGTAPPQNKGGNNSNGQKK